MKANRYFLVGLFSVLWTAVWWSAAAEAQTTVSYEVRSDSTRYFTVDGRPFLPMGGWQGSGLKPAKVYDDAEAWDDSNGREQARRDLEAFGESGGNLTFGIMDPYGRILGQGNGEGWRNSIHDGAPTGALKPGAYVEAARWLVREAHQLGIFTIIDLSHFVAPVIRPELKRIRSIGDPVSTNMTYPDDIPFFFHEELPCSQFKKWVVDRERAAYRGYRDRGGEFVYENIPEVSCGSAGVPTSLPFWEWNLWYAVYHLRDESGLFGWHLADEPEGAQLRNAILYCGHSDTSSRNFRSTCLSRSSTAWQRNAVIDTTEISTFGTPALLYYAYDRIKEFEQMGAPATTRHPVFVDVANMWAFVQKRASNDHWSSTSQPMVGPFDIDPASTSSYRFPADAIIQEAGGSFAFTGTNAGDQLDRLPPNWGIERVSRSSAMIQELLSGNDYPDPLWGALYLGRADVSDSPALPDSQQFNLRAGSNDHAHARVLNNREIVFQALNSLINGLGGMWWYGMRFLPDTGEEQPWDPAVFERVNRFTEQFMQESLDEVFLSERLAGPEDFYANGGTVEVRELTGYWLDDPVPQGSDGNYTRTVPTSILDGTPYGQLDAPYTYGFFARNDPRCFLHSDAPGAWGAAGNVPREGSTRNDICYRQYPGYEHLRTASYQHGEERFFFVSNAFDARVHVEMDVSVNEASVPEAEELHFDLDAPSAMWTERSLERCGTSCRSLSLVMEPFEVRVFKFR